MLIKAHFVPNMPVYLVSTCTIDTIRQVTCDYLHSVAWSLLEEGLPPGINATVTVIIQAAIAANVNIVENPPVSSYNHAMDGTAAAETVKDKTYFTE